MFELNYRVDSAAPVGFAATPLLAFRLNVQAADPDVMIHNVLLHCQLQIETTRRPYSDHEKTQLLDLFGEPNRWSNTLRTLLWTHAQVLVPPFRGETLVDLHVPCSFDFNVATTKYLHGLDSGDVPLEFLFSGSIFYADETGLLRMTRISWEKEATYRLPVELWKQLMDQYYPNTAWLRLRRDEFDKLYQFKVRMGYPTWEQTIEHLLDYHAATRINEESVAPLVTADDQMESHGALEKVMS